MKRKKIVIDMDGVCADFAHGFTTFGKYLGLGIEPYGTRDQKTYGFTEMSHEHKALIWDQIIMSSTFWRQLPTLLDIQEIVALRNLERHELYFLTARLGNKPKHQTEMWLADIGIYCPTVVVVNSYRPDPTKNAPILKRAFCIAIGADWFLDDKPAIVAEVAHEKNTVSVLREWGYSRDFPHTPRVKSFTEFNEMVGKDES